MSATRQAQKALRCATSAAPCPKLFAELHETIWRVGAAQLLRAQLVSKLRSTSQIHGSILNAVVATADSALLGEIRAALGGNADVGGGSTSAPKGDGAVEATATLATDLCAYLEACGLSQPSEQVMMVAPPLACLPLVLAVFTQSMTAKMTWSATFDTLVSNGKMSDDSLDGAPLVAGIATLHQFHASSCRIPHTVLARAIAHRSLELKLEADIRCARKSLLCSSILSCFRGLPRLRSLIRSLQERCRLLSAERLRGHL